ncbi:MAG: S41 family peptidase [Chloroflexota bacterium]
MLVYRAGNRLRMIKADTKPSGSGNNRTSGWIDLERAKVSIVPAREWQQMYREAWRLQRDQFWTPDMSQVDWLAAYERYLPLLDRISSRDELSDLLGEMQGELGTSHTYEYGGDYRFGPFYSQGKLGADFSFDAESESWQISHIVQGDIWNEKTSSPLLKPGIDIGIGDRIVAINGRSLSPTYSPRQALVSLGGETVALTVARDDAEPRTFNVKALRSETDARYREWVEGNRRQVHKATNGRIGYIHIPNMGPEGFAEFYRSYLAEVERDGLLIDVRYNGGGNVSQLLLEKLTRRPLGYRPTRWGKQPDPYPNYAINGPLVALTNQNAASDGDIFSHVFKQLGLGPLVGKRTWGGVVGIWPRHSLVDKTTTTQPEFSTWFNDVGWGIENYGAEPDIEIDNSPQDYANGRDAQLERAIAETLALLAENPPETPDFGERPDLSFPKLT